MHYSGGYFLQRDTAALLSSTTPCWQVSNTRLRRAMHWYSTPPPCLSTRAMGTPDGLWKKTAATCSTTQHSVLRDLHTYCSHGKQSPFLEQVEWFESAEQAMTQILSCTLKDPTLLSASSSHFGDTSTPQRQRRVIDIQKYNVYTHSQV